MILRPTPDAPARLHVRWTPLPEKILAVRKFGAAGVGRFPF
jgi:hypothetical protein